MKRLVTDQLGSWARSERRKPLLLRGARQVGKTWAVTDFGANHFDGRLRALDLEKRRDLHPIFADDLTATRMLSQLELALDARIEPGRDVLFLDEIQACPRALVALRYFYEELPELHVIAAGSLIEFALGRLSFPVGRVQFLNVYPMAFLEFLWACSHDHAAEIVQRGPAPLDNVTHDLMLDRLREYLFVGGLPEAVRLFSESRLMRDAFLAQGEVLEAYRADFGKYAPRVSRDTLDEVLTSVAGAVGSQIKFSNLAEGPTIPTIKNAFTLLERAQVVHRVAAVKHVGLPLGAGTSSRRFKAIMVDLSLLHRLSQAPMDSAFAASDLLGIYRGGLAEQFVGQELLAAGDRELHYWSRAAKSSTAEVDYLASIHDRIAPVEVKSGAAGRLRSMHQLLLEHPECAPGIVLSTRPYAQLPEQCLEFVPLYYAGFLGRFSGEPSAGP
ncbi:MAG TPA: AAA family ATPase [Thermoleophilia bacterium]|nr:AAA family ATPase [Thermoleophilia bacterium]